MTWERLWLVLIALAFATTLAISAALVSPWCAPLVGTAFVLGGFFAVFVAKNELKKGSDGTSRLSD